MILITLAIVGWIIHFTLLGYCYNDFDEDTTIPLIIFGVMFGGVVGYMFLMFMIGKWLGNKK